MNDIEKVEDLGIGPLEALGNALYYEPPINNAPILCFGLNDDSVNPEDMVDDVLDDQVKDIRNYSAIDFPEYELIEEFYDLGSDKVLNNYCVTAYKPIIDGDYFNVTGSSDLWLGIRINGGDIEGKVCLNINGTIVDELQLYQDNTYRLTNPVPLFLNPSLSQINIGFISTSKNTTCFNLYGKFIYNTSTLYGCMIEYSKKFVYYFHTSRQHIYTIPIIIEQPDKLYKKITPNML
jgi:hypothetical protein